MEQFLQEINLGQIIGSGALVTLLITTFIEITPIKWNPLTSILGWLGSRMNKTLIEKVDKQELKIDSLENKLDMHEIDYIRWEILNFANSCRHGRKHSRDEFVHIISLNEKYHKLLEARGMTNGLITVEYEYIESLYRERLEKNDFI